MMWRRERLKEFNTIEAEKGGCVALFNLVSLARAAQLPTADRARR
jgi:hypothetical protein